MTKLNIDIALDWIITTEGGYVNSPYDPGGETKYGISKKSYPNIDIKNITTEQAKAIYKHDYWQPTNCDIFSLPVALCLFDTAVHSGSMTAIRIAQLATKQKPDGLMGERTINAIRQMKMNEFVIQFLSYRAKRFIEKNSADNIEAHIRGWMVRLFKLQSFIAQVCGGSLYL